MSAWEASAGASDEWYTPKYIFDALGCQFDLDVASPRFGPLHVPCKDWIWQNSLCRPWHGFVWMNAPFGGRGDKQAWLDKFFLHGNGIALTPDRTSAPWFIRSWPRASLVLFMPKVKFIRPDGSIGKQPGNGTALWAAGPHAKACLYTAAERGLGILAEPKVMACMAQGLAA